MPRRAAVPPAGHRPPRRMPLHRLVSPKGWPARAAAASGRTPGSRWEPPKGQAPSVLRRCLPRWVVWSPLARPPTDRQNWTVDQVGAMLSVPWQEKWAVWQAVSLAVMRSRPIGSAPFVPGEKSSAGPSWHGLARCGSWHGLATCVGSTARAARQQR
eukprot:scaffold70538_cov56-Phaeocystis_antarctica.AAC.4